MGPYRHYSFKSQTLQLEPSLFLNLKTRSLTRFLKGCTGARRLPAGGGSPTLGDGEVEHEQGHAHALGYPARPEVACGGAATAASGGNGSGSDD